jgi:Na+-translocating ferredoxin:NAD+ oxidoreductase subunit G
MISPRSWTAAALVTLALARPASAQGVYFTTESVLKELFATSERVRFVEVVTESHKAALLARLGYVPVRAKYAVFIGQTGDTIDGYAVIDEERGQHLPITFAVKVDSAGKVERTEVMVYREGYGHEIRERRFQRQFVGKVAADRLVPGDDVVAISGATISSASMAVAVRRATMLVDIVRSGGAQPSGKGT